MQDYIIESLRKLSRERDPELMKILLNVDRDSSAPVRIRRRIPPTPSTSLPGQDHVFEMLIARPTGERDTKAKSDALGELDRMLNTPDKGEVLEKLRDLYGWQGVARMFYLLLERAGKNVLTNDADLWNMSVKRPQYRIIIRENADYGSGTIGAYSVFFSYGDVEKEISFTSSVHKVVYIWFLLHPRELMTVNQIASGVTWQPDSMKSVMQLLYKKKVQLSDSTDYTQIFSHIKNAIRTAWEGMGARGSLDWYTIQGGDKVKDRDTRNKDAQYTSDITRYYLNLPEDFIEIVNAKRRRLTCDTQRLEDCRMPKKTYVSIEDFIKDENTPVHAE